MICYFFCFSWCRWLESLGSCIQLGTQLGLKHTGWLPRVSRALGPAARSLSPRDLSSPSIPAWTSLHDSWLLAEAGASASNLWVKEMADSGEGVQPGLQHGKSCEHGQAGKSGRAPSRQTHTLRLLTAAPHSPLTGTYVHRPKTPNFSLQRQGQVQSRGL